MGGKSEKNTETQACAIDSSYPKSAFLKQYSQKSINNKDGGAAKKQKCEKLDHILICQMAWLCQVETL